MILIGCVVQEVAVQELLARDLEARETLALLDPVLQDALEANEEVGRHDGHLLISC